MSYLGVKGSESSGCLLPAVRARPLSYATRSCRVQCRNAALRLGGVNMRLQHQRRPPSHPSKISPATGPASAVVVASSAGSDLPLHDQPNVPSQRPPSRNLWAQWQNNAAEMRAQVAKLGLAAVLAYGLFDGITYTTFFVLAFLGYEKSTGKNPAANIQALLGIVILMWTGNNVTRPLRVAGAAALAPLVDKALRKIQKILNLPNQVFAFMVVVATFAALCLSVVGLLILSRWGK